MKTDQIVLADELVTFLEARLAEDEHAASVVAPLGEVMVMGGEVVPDRFAHYRSSTASEDGMGRRLPDRLASGHFGRWEPARVLAECQAKRLVIARLRQSVADQDRNAEEHAAEMRRPRRPPVASTRVPPDPPTRVPQLRSFGWELSGRKQGLFLALLALAQPYSEHPDFQEVWLAR